MSRPVPDRLPILILFGSLVDTVISLGRTSIQGDRAEGKFRSQPRSSLELLRRSPSGAPRPRSLTCSSRMLSFSASNRCAPHPCEARLGDRPRSPGAPRARDQRPSRFRTAALRPGRGKTTCPIIRRSPCTRSASTSVSLSASSAFIATARSVLPRRPLGSAARGAGANALVPRAECESIVWSAAVEGRDVETASGGTVRALPPASHPPGQPPEDTAVPSCWSMRRCRMVRPLAPARGISRSREPTAFQRVGAVYTLNRNSTASPSCIT